MRITTPHLHRAVRARRAALVLLIAVATVLLATLGSVTAPAAQAHDELVASTPAEGESFQEPPTEAQLTFSGDIERVGIAFSLTNDTGELLDLPTVPVLDGKTVTVALPSLEPAAYALAWRVVSSDGHPVSGTLSFAVGESAPIAPSTDPAGGGVDGTAQPGSEGREALPSWAIWAIGIGGVAVVLGAVVGMIARFRRG